MIVTPTDAMLADYSIHSYAKLQPFLKSYDWILQVYMNCLTDELKRQYVSRWKRLPYVELLDNVGWFNVESILPGDKVFFHGISSRPFEGKYEIGCMIWEREFRKMQSDYWCIVDADFEIIEPYFVQHIFNTLDNEESLYVYSTDFNSKIMRYNTYTDENAFLMDRYCTWFCAYKKQCLKCESPLYYHEEIIDGQKYVWDDTGKFQEDLQKQTNCYFKSISQIEQIDLRNELMYQYIHYGAFSKNKSLDTRYKIFLYRKVSLLSHRGLVRLNRKNILNKLVRFIFTKLRIYMYGSLKIERGKYHF